MALLEHATSEWFARVSAFSRLNSTGFSAQARIAGPLCRQAAGPAVKPPENRDSGIGTIAAYRHRRNKL
jgi:hypothetical protein